ncbi:type II secretion system protein [bacterium]|nr:type II secretion system protein [bacterium]
MKKNAFTLAEVLITLGIIGVVAALTIPTLMQKTNDKEISAAIKKSFANISNAIQLAEAEHGSIKSLDDVEYNYNNELGINGSNYIYIKYIMDNLKIVKACGYYGRGCFADSYDKESVTEDLYSMSGCYNFILADGSALCIRDGEAYPTFILDINGQKGPNKDGVDFVGEFSFNTDTGKLEPNSYIKRILME